MFKASEVKNKIESGDTVVLDKDQDTIIQQCCNCGEWHELIIKSKGKVRYVTFNGLDKEPTVIKHKTRILPI